jgi:hypothetical protein
MNASHRLTDRQMFAARPWRAADRTQIIVAVVDESPSRWEVILATLEGARLFGKPLDDARTPGSFSTEELQALYDESRGAPTA